MLKFTSLKCDIKYVTLIGNNGMQRKLRQISELLNADLIELEKPVSVLNTCKEKQLARAIALTMNVFDFTEMGDNDYASVIISQNGLFNKSGSAEVHIRDASTGECKRIAKWGINPDAFADVAEGNLTECKCQLLSKDGDGG